MERVRNEMVLSIIIPVYNVEKYIAVCLDSVLACNLEDCEILLSLLESEDQSEAICRDYQARHDCIRLVRQDGRGLSNARNCAMREVKGNYLLFLDSDDYIHSEMLNGLIDRLRRGEIREDVIVTDYCRVEHQSGITRKFYRIGENTPDSREMGFLPRVLRRRESFWNVWRFIYRRDFLSENHIVFTENTLGEDIDFTTSVFLAEPKILFTHSPYYVYNVDRGGSLMDQPTFRRLRDTLRVLTLSIERLRGSEFEYRDLLIARFQFEYILNIAQAVECDPDCREEALDLLDDCSEVLKNSRDPLVRAFRGIVRLIGVQGCAKLLHKAKLVRRRVRGKGRTEDK